MNRTNSIYYHRNVDYNGNLQTPPLTAKSLLSTRFSGIEITITNPK